jgi:hypothetical protein
MNYLDKIIKYEEIQFMTHDQAGTTFTNLYFKKLKRNILLKIFDFKFKEKYKIVGFLHCKNIDKTIEALADKIMGEFNIEENNIHCKIKKISLNNQMGTVNLFFVFNNKSDESIFFLRHENFLDDIERYLIGMENND